MLSLQSQLLQAQTQIITTEAKSESWLTRSWRPITMLTFTALLVADWLGFTAPNLTPEMKAKLYDIIQLGLGGYVIGRSAEKVVKEVKEPLRELVRRRRPPEPEEDFF
ncbi:MAG: 3TM-type holin [Aquificota bacterium]|nr:3TM-type holin [Aquificota bacterium]